MLEDFLDVNSVDAELITFPRETSLQTALFETKISPSAAVRVDFYMNERQEEFLFVYPIKTRLDLGKAKQATNSSALKEKDPELVFEATGYSKGMLPPVGVYGAKVYVDRSLQGKEVVLCKVGEKEFLKIPPDEIVDANEEAFMEKIAR